MIISEQQPGTPQVVERPEDLKALHALSHISNTMWKMLLDQVFVIPELATLSIVHLRLLYWVQEQGLVTLPEASQEFGVSHVAMRHLTTALVRRGLIERCGERHSAGVVYLRPTAAGCALLSRTEASQQLSWRKMLGQLSPDEQQKLARALHLLLQTEQESGLYQRLDRSTVSHFVRTDNNEMD